MVMEKRYQCQTRDSLVTGKDNSDRREITGTLSKVKIVIKER